MAEGCYVPNYFAASFKGVSFDALEASSEHGRRGAEGEFPFGEDTAYQDLGRRIRRFTISARFPKNSHIADSDALIAACETPGPGLLVHPTRGAVLVACPKLSVRDNVKEEMGVTYVDMDFVEAQPVGAGLSFGASLFGFGVGAIYTGIQTAFVEQFQIEQVRYYRIRDVHNTISSRMDTIKREFERFNAQNPTQEGWNAINTMQDIIDDPASLRDPKEGFEAFKRSMRSIAGIATGQAKYDSFKRIANDAAQVSNLPEEVGTAQDAVNMMTRTLAMVNMVQAAMETQITNLAAALDQYDQVVQIIDEELAAARATCQDDLFLSLRKFESDTKSLLLKRAYDLPALVTFNFAGHVHSLVAAYEIYGDAKRFKDIESFNSARWPFLVGPNVTAPRA